MWVVVPILWKKQILEVMNKSPFSNVELCCDNNDIIINIFQICTIYEREKNNEED